MSQAVSAQDSSAVPHGIRRKTITCPHCWWKFETCDIVWVSRHQEMRGDTVLGNDEFLRFLPTRFNVKGEAIDARGMPCQKLACPRCHLVVPRVLLQYEPIIFSLIGVPFSGKSYFLTSMTWEMARILPSKFSLVFGDVDPFCNLTLNEYQKALFLQESTGQLVGIDKTQLDSTSHYQSTNLDGQSVLLPKPFLFVMRPLSDHPNSPSVESLTRIICLYDNAGEHFLVNQDTVDRPGTQHLARSKVLLFLFDPILDPRIRERCRGVSCDPQLTKQSHKELQATILTEAAGRVRQYANLPAHEKLNQPLIVLFSKADIWGKLIGEDFLEEPFISKPNGRAVLDLARIRSVSKKMREYFKTITPELIATAEDCCKDVIYMPISAMGCSPQWSDGKFLVRPSELKPRWASVPLLYSFAMWATGLVPKT